MNHAVGMGIGECISDLQAVTVDIIGGQPLAVDHAAQRAAFQILHRNVGRVIGFADFINRADIGMIQGRSSAGLAQQSFAACFVGGQGGVEKLQRHIPAQNLVFGAVHFSHAASTELLEDLIVANPVCRLRAGRGGL